MHINQMGDHPAIGLDHEIAVWTRCVNHLAGFEGFERCDRVIDLCEIRRRFRTTASKVIEVGCFRHTTTLPRAFPACRLDQPAGFEDHMLGTLSVAYRARI